MIDQRLGDGAQAHAVLAVLGDVKRNMSCTENWLLPNWKLLRIDLKSAALSAAWKAFLSSTLPLDFADHCRAAVPAS